MPRVYNKHHRNAPPDAIYVGRPSVFGNPFIVGTDGDRLEVIEKYEQKLKDDPVMMEIVRQHLRGKDLVCWCYPQACHADVLLQVANDG